MPDQTTNIDYSAVKESVDEILSCSTIMGNIFDDFKKEMGIITSGEVLEGTAGDTLEEKVKIFQAKFDSYKNKVIEFSEVINSASGTTEQTEKGLASEAEQLPE